MANVTLVDFLVWIETHQHHKASTLDTSKGKGLLLQGYGRDQIRFYGGKYSASFYEPSRDPFDSRMYRATAKGRKAIRNAGRWPEVAEKQRKRSA